MSTVELLLTNPSQLFAILLDIKYKNGQDLQVICTCYAFIFLHEKYKN
jgi:hypothetical protein